MDITTKLVASELRGLANRIDEGHYGTDIDFDGDAFLEDLQDNVVDTFGEEIVKS